MVSRYGSGTAGRGAGERSPNEADVRRLFKTAGQFRRCRPPPPVARRYMQACRDRVGPIGQ